MNTNKAIDGLSAFEKAEYLDTEEATAEYLTQVLADYKEGDLAEALGCIAKARGINEIAKASGLTREELYKALMTDSLLSLDTIQRVCMGLGLKLGVVLA
ncbi:MAG: putative addiction module antidote protein [Cryomorphaceae bacterium]|jgi:probable addiction module antidote protein|nr:putative addiction module antidote protein [Cryomorphaceae bacterium]